MSPRRKLGSLASFTNILIIVGVLVIVALNFYGNAAHLHLRSHGHESAAHIIKPPILPQRLVSPGNISVSGCAETTQTSTPLPDDPCKHITADSDGKLRLVQRGESQDDSNHILVFGAASFIGSHLVDMLLSLGYSVTAVDNLEVGSDLQFVDLMHERLKFEYSDFKNEDPLKQVISKRKAAGAFYISSRSDGARQAKTLKDIVKRTGGVSKLVILTMTPQVTPEEQELVSSDQTFFGSALQLLVISCHMVYGPRDPLENIYEMASEIVHGSTKDFRNFIHVQDVVRALVLAFQSSNHGLVVRLDSHGDNMKLEEACRSKKLFGFTRSYDFAETMHKMSKAAREGKVDFLPQMWTQSITVGALEGIMPGWAASDPYERTRRIKNEIKADHKFLDGTLGKLKEMQNCKKTKILIVVRTAPGTKAERMPRITKTWADAPGENIRIVGFSEGDKDEELSAAEGLPPMITSTVCSKHFKDDKGHGLRFCCKTAIALWHASTNSSLMMWDWDFVYLVDDDVYVFLDHLQLKLCTDFSDGTPRVIGLPGCNTQVCQGMCGGGGFGFSRKDLSRFLGKGSIVEFVKEFIKTCESCEGWDDISVGMLARSRGMQLGWMPGSEPWEMDLEAKVDKVVSVHELPTIWHYVREDMSAVHVLHAQAGEAMTAKHYIKKKLDYVDLPQVVDHTRKVRLSMGLEDKTKFKGKKTKMEVYWQHSSCTSEHYTIGRFHTAEDCAPHVITSSRCNEFFQFAFGQYDWGCRCCDSVKEQKPNHAWKVYRIVEV